jgi:uncharacterized membrane protein
VSFHLGRIASLSAYVALVALALHLAPRGRLVILVIGSLPSSVFQAATYNADSFTIALTMLLVALVLRCRFSADATRRTAVATFVVALFLALGKNTYWLLAPLALLVPDALLGARRPRALKAAFMTPILLAALAWARWASGLRFDPYVDPTVDQQEQLRHVLGNPFEFLAVLFRTLFTWPTSNYLVDEFIGWYGMFRNAAAGYPAPPGVITMLAYVLLGAAYAASFGPRRTLDPKGHALSLWPAALAATTGIAVIAALYLTWTPVGRSVVEGVQGRYFLPVAVVPIVTVVMRRDARDRVPWWPFAAGVALLGAYSIAKVILYYYY